MKITTRYEYWAYDLLLCNDGLYRKFPKMSLVQSVWIPSNTLRKVFELIK